MTPIWIGKYLHLLLCMSVLSQTEGGSKRKKREWILPASRLMENVDYTKQEFIAKIWSDKHTHLSPVEYSLTGRGADIEPYNLFIVDPQNGLIRITGILDREEIPQYNLKGIGKYKNGSLAEGEVHLKIQVLDQNDNPPKFSFSQGSVKECSNIGTPVMQIKAEDADEPGTSHTKIAYSIVKQIPEGSGAMFSINRDTGEIYVKQHTLDRETLDSYTLIVQGVDMGGATNGNTGTGTVQIKVLDINDNVPTLEKDEYTGNVDEGAVDVVVMRIKALDKDLENTENWLTHFEIIEGNEAGVFSIETDPKTNEGILKLVKPVDYEKVKQLNLGLVISNVAPFVNETEKSLDSDKHMGGTGHELGPDKQDKKPLNQGGKRYSVKVSVNNLSDGLVFSPSVKVFPVSEDAEKVQVPKMIGSFPAMDGDTGQIAENVRYAKGYDPDNWLSINEQTSEIKLVKTPDRESTFLVNGTYFAKIICITQDVPPKTATGTIALQVEDSNDHCPKLTSTYQSVCSDTTVINVTAFDEDIDPNGEPYKFVSIEEETRGKWELVPVNGTTVSFHAKELLWPGFYELTVEIFDVKGLGCEDKQKLQLEVCTCEEGDACVVALRAAQRRVSSAKVGVPAIGLLVAGVALLMLVPMFLLFCQCGAMNEFMELPFDAKEHLISYHTEGKGEDKEVPLLSVPDQQPKVVAGYAGSNVSTMLSHVRGQVMEIDSMFEYQNNTFSFQRNRSHPSSSLFKHEVQDIYGGIALPDNFLHDYFTQKARHEAANPPLTDSLLVYNHEGQDSPVGSLGCCSLLESGNNLEFLNDLGPKFMALGEICSPSKPCSPLSDAEISANVLDTNSNSESSVTTSIDQDSKPVIPPLDQDKADTKALNNNSDSLSTMHNSQIQLVQQQQPLYYLVEHQVPTTVILAERPSYGAYLINGSAATGELILEGRTNLSSPESPTLPTVWLQGNQSHFQHHELPVIEKVVLMQNECNVTPTMLLQAHTNNMVQGIDSVLVQDCSALDPGSSTQAQAKLQIQDSSLKISDERDSENVFMLRHDIASLSESEDALAQLNMKEVRPQFELAPPLGKGQENMEEFSNQVSKDDTDSTAQHIAPSVINVMPSIFPDILLARPTTEEVLAKANAIQKELEQTFFIEGFNNNVSFTQPSESAANIISVNDDLSGKESDGLVAKTQKDLLNEPNLSLTVIDTPPVLPPDTELNGNEQVRMPVCEYPTSSSSVVSTETMKETVLDCHEPSVFQLIRNDDTLIECSTRLNKTDRIIPNDSNEFAVIENTSLLVTQEIISMQSLTHEIEKETEFVASQSVKEDSTVTEDTDLNYASHQELADDLETTFETQDISDMNLMEDREVGVAIDFQVTLLTETTKEDLHQQNLEDVKKKNERGLYDIDESVSQLEEVSVPVLNMHFEETNEIHTEQSLLTFDTEEDTAMLADSDVNRQDVGDELQSGIQVPEDTHVMDQKQTAIIELNDEPDQELVMVLDKNFKTPKQDTALMILSVDTEVGDITEVQMNLLTEEIKEELHQQNLEDLTKNEPGINAESFSLIEEDKATVQKIKEISYEQGLLTLDPEADTEMASFDTEKEDVGDELQAGIQMPEDTHVMNQECCQTVAKRHLGETQEIHSEQSLPTIVPEKDTTALATSNPEGNVGDLTVNFEATKQDTAWLTSEAGKEIKNDINEVQITLPTEEIKKEVEKNRDKVANHINVGVKWLDEVSLTVEERSFTVTQKILTDQNLCTPHSGKEYKLTRLKSEKKSDMDQLQPYSMERTEDTSVIEQEGITAVEMNKESDLSELTADHQSNEEVDSNAGISGSSETSTASTDPAIVGTQRHIDTSNEDNIDKVQNKVSTDIDGEAVVGFPAAVHSDKEQDVLHPKQEQFGGNKNHQDEDNDLLCNRQSSGDVSEQETHLMSEQGVYSSQHKLTRNTVNFTQNITASHTEGAYIEIKKLREEEKSSGTVSQESVSLSIQPQNVDSQGQHKYSCKDTKETTEASQSSFVNASSVQDKEVQQTLPQAEITQVVSGETKGNDLQSGLSQEATLTAKGATITSSEGLIQELHVLGEKAVHMSSEVMEQVLTTSNNIPVSGATNLQMEPEQEATVITKNKDRNSKKSDKKVTSPKSPIEKCKPQ